MMNGGHWDLQRRLMALLSASDLMWRGGGARVCMVFEKWRVKVASEEVDNETIIIHANIIFSGYFF